jgi:hypothetical protein
MTKITPWALAICFVLQMGLGSAAQAQMPKQGKFEMMGIYNGKLGDSFKIGDHKLSYYPLTLLNFNKAGKGFLHNTSSVCMLIAAAGDFTSYCVTTDMDGDQIHSIATVVGGELGVSGGGRRSTFTGGTGKYEGIQGGYSYEAIYAPKVEGVLLGHIAGAGEYAIP